MFFIMTSTVKFEMILKKVKNTFSDRKGSHSVRKVKKNGLQKFCDFTSMHGFTEVYHAKSLFWVYFWLVWLGLAFGMTSYQVYQAIIQYSDQSSITVIQPATNDEIVYPPLKLCYSHWINWADFQKGYSLQFSKASILYGLSFLTNIYTSTWFNVSEAETNFTSTLKLNNMTTLTSFYQSISRYAPLRVWGADPEEVWGFNYSLTGGDYFKHTEFMTYQMDSLLFCHVEYGEEIINYISKKKARSLYTTNANTLTFALNDQKYFTFHSDITAREYNSYMAEWIQERTPQYWIFDEDYEHASHNYTNFNAPMLLFPDGYRKVGIKMASEVDEYFVTVKASSHRWKNTNQNPCNQGIKSVISDMTCTDTCTAEVSYAVGVKESFSLLFKIGQDILDNLIGNKIYFIHGLNDTTATNATATIVMSSGHSTQVLNMTPVAPEHSINTIKITKDNCSAKCMQGCEKWNFEFGVTTVSIYNSIHRVADKKRTNIQVDYPLDSDILMMIETDSQTWENFIGNVGGLLGIWTGASILSFVQMIYLCCCSDSDCTSVKEFKTQLVKRIGVHHILPQSTQQNCMKDDYIFKVVKNAESLKILQSDLSPQYSR